MSSKARKITSSVLSRRINTVLQVLSIMQEQANKMSWLQRFKISWHFLWHKNINVFFSEADKNGN